MEKTTYKLNTEGYLESFKQARGKRAKKLSQLPYAKKIEIMESLQADHKVIQSSISSLKPSKT